MKQVTTLGHTLSCLEVRATRPDKTSLSSGVFYLQTSRPGNSECYSSAVLSTVEHQAEHQHRSPAHTLLPLKCFTLHSSNTQVNYILTHPQQQVQLYLSDQHPTQHIVTFQATQHPCATVLFLRLWHSNP